jgi:hypothetical protein
LWDSISFRADTVDDDPQWQAVDVVVATNKGPAIYVFNRETGGHVSGRRVPVPRSTIEGEEASSISLFRARPPLSWTSITEKI